MNKNENIYWVDILGGYIGWIYWVDILGIYWVDILDGYIGWIYWMDILGYIYILLPISHYPTDFSVTNKIHYY